MDKRIQLAKKALALIQDKDFECALSAYGGGACGEGWSDTDTLYLTAEEIRGLILCNLKDEILFSGLKTAVINWDDISLRLDEMAEQGACLDELEDEESESWSCRGECDDLEYYIDSWCDFIGEILNGSVTEDNFDEALAAVADDEDDYMYDHD